MEKNLKIGVCTLSIGETYKKYTRYTLQNKNIYCEKHGYTLIEDESVYNKDKPIPWSKLILLLKYLSDYDYLVWIDADIYIMNNEIKIENLIEKYNNVDIICGSDWRMPNTGVLIIKNTEFSKEFLQKVYDNEYDPNSDPNERYLNWEQGSFINLLDKNSLNCKEKIQVTDPVEMNSYWFNYFPGHFVLHFAGVRHQLLEYLLRDHCPDRMDIDTDKTYNARMEWLAGPIRRDMDEKLRIDKENERKGLLEHPIEYVSEKEYLDIIEKYNYLFDALLNIVKSTGEELEGNCFFYHRTFDKISGNNKGINLFSLGKNCSRILEIGFNAGHSCLLFLLSNPENKIDCFDICEHSYTNLCFDYLSKTFPGRINLYQGDSKKTLPDFKRENPEKFYDLIHIDGSHEINDANCDFYNTFCLSQKNGFVIFDDVNLPQMKHLWNLFVKDGHVREVYSLPVETYPHVIGKYN